MKNAVIFGCLPILMYTIHRAEEAMAYNNNILLLCGTTSMKINKKSIYYFLKSNTKI